MIRLVSICLLVSLPFAAPTKVATLEYAAPPGANYDVAEFRLWYPEDVATLRGGGLGGASY